MLCAQFIFRPGSYDAEFHTLDDEIEAFAQSLDGYVGVDRWVSDDGASRNSIYYFRDRDAMNLLARYPSHLVAKREYARWYDGYQIVLSEVVGSYGDGRIEHPAASRQP